MVEFEACQVTFEYRLIDRPLLRRTVDWCIAGSRDRRDGPGSGPMGCSQGDFDLSTI